MGHRGNRSREELFQDGITKVPDLLTPRMLEQLRDCYEWSLAHLSARAFHETEEGRLQIIDANNPDALSVYREVVLSLPFGGLLADLWHSQNVWLYAEEVLRRTGKVERGGWHQDLAYLPATGENWVNCWIPFEPLPASHAIEVVRGSHHGVLYQGMSFNEHEAGSPQSDARPPAPPMPDIEEEREEDPGKWDILSFGVEPGDVILLHPATLHNAAQIDERVPERNTLVLRFFGDDATWTDLPDHQSGLREDQKRAAPGGGRGEPGEPFRSALFLKVH